jgi:hypothetical protein
LFFVTRGYVWTIPVSSWKHFGSTAFLKYSYSEVRICTVYGAIWLERQMFWANFRAETRLGGFAATEDFVRRYLRKGRSLQVQLLPRGVGFLFLILYPAASSSASSSSAASASSTIFHTPSFTYHFVTHKSSHTTCFTSRSSTTSFVFPSFPVPATTFVAHYHWKKLTCGVIRSFYFFFKTSRRGTGVMVRIRVTIPNNSLKLFRLVNYCDLSR